MKFMNPKQMNELFSGEPPVFSASIRLTKACNCNCKHCYADGGKQLKNELSTEEVQKVMRELSNLGAMSVFFTGGEPFIRKDIYEILSSAANEKLGIFLSTNGFNIDEKSLKKIDAKAFKLFQISLDSANERTHDEIRGKKGTFQQAVKTLEKSVNILNKNVGVGSVLMKQNEKEIQKVLGFAAKKGADTFALITLLPWGRASHYIDPTIEAKLKAIRNIFSEYSKYKDKIKFAENTTLPPSLIPKEFREELWDSFCFCSFPYTLAVEANGEVAPCDGFLGNPKASLGNIRKKSIFEIWNDSKLINSLKKIKPSDLKGVCKKCKYNDYCMGGCRAAAFFAYKGFNMPDPLCQQAFEKGHFPKDCLR